MESSFWVAFGASLIAGAMTTAGVLAIRRYDRWARANTTYFACFTAGVLLAVSFLRIIPRSSAMNADASAYVFGFYFFMYLFNRFLTAHVCDRPDRAEYALGLVPLVGIGFQSPLDGVLYSVGFSVSLFTGALLAIGTVLHEFPERVATYTLLLQGGISRRRSLWLAVAAAALTTPLGTLLSSPLITRVDDPLLGLLLAGSAGALIYVGAPHLLPRAEQESRRFCLVATTTGILVAVGILLTDLG